MSKSPKYIADLIDRLETKIEAEITTPEYLAGLQRQLDAILSAATVEGRVGHDYRYRQYALELQALIYGTQGNDTQALRCIDDAVAEAGSVKKFHSRLLKVYIRNNPSVATAHKVVQTGPGDLSLLTEREQEFLRSYKLEQTPEIDFLVRSSSALAIMIILSSHFYCLYWMYKNWQAVQDVSGRKISPFWRTVFNIFYIWPLFKIMAVLAKSRGFPRRYASAWLAAGFLFIPVIFLPLYLVVTSRAVLWVIGILASCAVVVFLVVAQQAAFFAVAKQPASRKKRRPINYVECLFVLAGTLALVTSTIFSLRVHSKYAGYTPLQQFRLIGAEQHLKLSAEEYQQCTTYLAAVRPNLDTTNQSQVKLYNAETVQCNAIGQAKLAATKRYDLLLHRK